MNLKSSKFDLKIGLFGMFILFFVLAMVIR